MVNLNIVGVKMEFNPNKIYWYELPDDLRRFVDGGRTVACECLKSFKTGVVETGIISGDDIGLLLADSGVSLPAKRVVGVITNRRLRDIRIPKYMEESKPGIHKLNKRIKEYYNSGHFDTNVAVSDNNELIDGYTAYLVAKMFGLKTIPVVRMTKS